MAKVNSDILIRSVLLEIAFVSFLFLGSSFDDATLAANQVLIQFLNITAYAMDGFAFAAEALVGKALGAKNRLIFRKSAVMTSQWGFGSVVVMALAFYVFGNTIINVMTTAEDVRRVSYEYLTVDGSCASCWSSRLDAGWHFYWCHQDSRYAQYDVYFILRLSDCIWHFYCLNMTIMGFGLHSLSFQLQGE